MQTLKFPVIVILFLLSLWCMHKSEVLGPVVSTSLAQIKGTMLVRSTVVICKLQNKFN